MLSMEIWILVPNKGIDTIAIRGRLKSTLSKFYGRYEDLIKQYEVSLSQTWHSGTWPYTVTPSIDQTFHRVTEMEVSIAQFAITAAIQQWTLTPPFTWSCSMFGLAFVLMLRPFSHGPAMFLNFEYQTCIGTSILVWKTISFKKSAMKYHCIFSQRSPAAVAQR